MEGRQRMTELFLSRKTAAQGRPVSFLGSEACVTSKRETRRAANLCTPQHVPKIYFFKVLPFKKHKSIFVSNVGLCIKDTLACLDRPLSQNILDGRVKEIRFH